MTQERSLSAEHLADAVEKLCRQFGVGPTFVAILVTSWRRQPTNRVVDLSDWVQRDLGLNNDKRADGSMRYHTIRTLCR